MADTSIPAPLIATPDTPSATRSSLLDRLASMPVVLGAGLVLIVTLIATNAPGATVSDPDIWWHLANARLLLTTHHFLHADPFSFTTGGVPWINFEWLSELPFYAAFQRFGSAGLLAVTIALTAGIVTGTYALALRRSRSLIASFLCGFLTVLFCTVSLAPRTLLFGWLLLVAELWILWTTSEDRDRLWLLAPLFALWINLHGSWLIGFALFVMYTASGFLHGTVGDIEVPLWSAARRRRTLVVLAASFAALFVNPYGWRTVWYPFDLAFFQPQNVGAVDEWASLDFHTSRGKLVFVVVAAILLLNLIRRRRWQLTDLAFAAISVYAAFTYTRFVFFAGIVLMPLLAMDLAPFFGEERPAHPRVALNLGVIALVLFLAVRRLPSSSTIDTTLRSDFPVAALPAIQSLPAGARIFNQYEWGGYLTWAAPAQRDFIDGRADVFAHAGIMTAYLQSMRPGQLAPLLEQHQADAALVPTHGPFADQLRTNRQWRPTYTDGQTTLFLRIQPQP